MNRKVYALFTVTAVVCLVCSLAPADVLTATARDADGDNNHFLFGPAVSTVVGAGGTYAGIASQVTAVDNPLQPNDFLGTTAELKAGSNPTAGDITISFAWRNRTALERDGMAFLNYEHAGQGHRYMLDGGSTREGVALAYDAYNIVSDVADITGVQGTYVLQMSYDENSLYHWHHPELTPQELEVLFQSKGRLFLGWLETDGLGKEVPDGEIGVPQLLDYDEWCNAISGNSHIGNSAVANFNGTWDEFIVAYPAAATNLDDYLGSWGVDIGDDLAWAVLDHNSPFAVSPEPGTIVLLIAGSISVIVRRRRRQA